MPEDAIASAACRTCASVTPHPKLFQLFQPRGGVSAGLPGAAEAVEWAEAVKDTATASVVAAKIRSSRLPDGRGTVGSFQGRAPRAWPPAAASGSANEAIVGGREQTADDGCTGLAHVAYTTLASQFEISVDFRIAAFSGC